MVSEVLHIPGSYLCVSVIEVTIIFALFIVLSVVNEKPLHWRFDEVRPT
jgi:hypothetical protein